MSEQENKSAKIRRFVSSKLDWLHKMPENAYRAELANLRRGAGKKPGDLPELWGTILKDMPEEFQGKEMKPKIKLNEKEGKKILNTIRTLRPFCPECGEPLIFEGGCNICKSCGYTKCD